MDTDATSPTANACAAGTHQPSSLSHVINTRQHLVCGKCHQDFGPIPSFNLKPSGFVSALDLEMMEKKEKLARRKDRLSFLIDAGCGKYDIRHPWDYYDPEHEAAARKKVKQQMYLDASVHYEYPFHTDLFLTDETTE